MGALVGIQRREGAGVDQLLAQLLVFGVRPIAPVDVVRLAQIDHVLDPSFELGVFHIRGCVHRVLHEKQKTPVRGRFGRWGQWYSNTDKKSGHENRDEGQHENQDSAANR